MSDETTQLDVNAPAPTASQDEAGKPVQGAEKSPARKAPAKQTPAETQTAGRTGSRSAGKSTRKPSPPRKYTGASTMAAAKKDTMKETFETVSAVSNEAVKEGFEKSLSAMNEFSAFQKDSVDALIASATSTSKSLEEINTSAMEFAKKSLEDGAAAAQSLASAKSIQDLIEIQANYAKSAMDAYLSEVNRHTDLMSGLFKNSFKPLNDRVAAAVEVMQSQR
jgi:phasin family protein